MKNHRLTTIGLLLLTLCLVCSAWADTAKPGPQEPMDSLILAMSTDNPQIFDGAIAIGSVALHRGHPVTMLLRLDAIKVAVAKNNYPFDKQTLAQELSAFIKSGGKVIAGGKCIKDMGLKPQDLLPGVQVGTPDAVMGMIFTKDTKILSY